MDSSDNFYTSFSESYADYSSLRNNYLSAVNNFIVSEVREGKNMVDVGGGDGKRGREIADSLGLKQFTIIESSAGMAKLARSIPNAQVIEKDISDSSFEPDGKYDVILCLWNVLGHIPVDRRAMALKNLRALLSDGGFIFLDVNNRYNLHYGLKAVIKNIGRDIFSPDKNNGDFVLNMENKQGQKISTITHVFSPYETERLFKQAGLRVVKRAYIHYKTGQRKNNFWGGHLVYKLGKY